METKRCFFIILLSLFSLLNDKTNAQAPDWLWAKSLGGTTNGIFVNIAVDASGNVYTIGDFYGTMDFDPDASGTFYLTSAGYNDIFISKFDSSGNFIWAKHIGGISNDRGTSIALDGYANVYTTGYFRDTVDFDPGAGVFNLTAPGARDIFISKLDTAGNFVWAKQMGGINDDGGDAIALDASGNIFTAGEFTGTADFDPDSTGTFTLTWNSGGYADIFISKLDSSGNFVWAKAIVGVGDIKLNSIALDAHANIYTTGYFQKIADFDPDSLVNYDLISFSFSADIFISKLDSFGNFIWAKHMGKGHNDEGRDIAVDASGNVYTTGTFYGNVDFDPDSSATFNLNSAGTTDIFISKLDSLGKFTWAKRFGGTDPDAGYSIALDASGNVFTTGSFIGTVDFYPGAGTFNLTSNGSDDIFISKLNSSGNFIWAKATGGSGGEIVQSMALDTFGNAHVIGIFGSPSVAFSSTTLTNANNTDDIFIAKLRNTITGIENVEHLNGFSIYPNPVKDLLVIGCPLLSNKKVTIDITDIAGRLIYKNYAAAKHIIEVNTKNFSNGIYLVKINSEDFIETKKFIVER